VENLDRAREEEETENNRNSVNKGAKNLANGKLSERRPAKINLNTWKAVQ